MNWIYFVAAIIFIWCVWMAIAVKLFIQGLRTKGVHGKDPWWMGIGMFPIIVLAYLYGRWRFRG